MTGRVYSGLLALTVLMAGCGGNPPVPATYIGISPRGISTAKAGPPRCEGQVITHGHAEVTERIPRKGATLCVPSFSGFGGLLGFPGVRPAPQPVKLIVTVPKKTLHPIFNLEWLPAEQFTFGKAAPPGGISGSTMTPGKTYTGYAVIYFKGSHKEVAPCYSVASRGKYGGVFNGLGTLMEKQGGSFLSWDLMIFDGKDTSHKC
ncbi:MAG: hypothetical protein WA304_08000 [Candidatus Cybelea sp.]